MLSTLSYYIATGELQRPGLSLTSLASEWPMDDPNDRLTFDSHTHHSCDILAEVLWTQKVVFIIYVSKKSIYNKN